MRFEVIGLVSVALLHLSALTACSPVAPPPVVDHSPVFDKTSRNYLVGAGDTLYSIAWRFDLDYRSLASANGLKAPFTIYPGQRLTLSEGIAYVAGSRNSTRQNKTARGVVAWTWPTDAGLSRGYSSRNAGFDFQISNPDSIRSAAAGEVVYAGTGLAGYRHLVIIKHDPRHLSAYSSNLSFTVKEGESVRAGSGIARSYSGVTGQTLHFEIRRDGEPIDPKSVLGDR